MPVQSIADITKEFKGLFIEQAELFFNIDLSPANIQNLKNSGHFPIDTLAQSLVSNFCEFTTDRTEREERYHYCRGSSAAAEAIDSFTSLVANIHPNNGALITAIRTLCTTSDGGIRQQNGRLIKAKLQRLQANQISNTNPHLMQRLNYLLTQITETHFYQAKANLLAPNFSRVIGKDKWWNFTNVFHYLNFFMDIGKGTCGAVNLAVNAASKFFNNHIVARGIFNFIGICIKLPLGAPFLLLKLITFGLAKIFSWNNVCAFFKGELFCRKSAKVEAIEMRPTNRNNTFPRTQASEYDEKASAVTPRRSQVIAPMSRGELRNSAVVRGEAGDTPRRSMLKSAAASSCEYVNSPRNPLPVSGSPSGSPRGTDQVVRTNTLRSPTAAVVSPIHRTHSRSPSQKNTTDGTFSFPASSAADTITPIPPTTSTAAIIPKLDLRPALKSKDPGTLAPNQHHPGASVSFDPKKLHLVVDPPTEPTLSPIATFSP